MPFSSSHADAGDGWQHAELGQGSMRPVARLMPHPQINAGLRARPSFICAQPFTPSYLRAAAQNGGGERVAGTAFPGHEPYRYCPHPGSAYAPIHPPYLPTYLLTALSAKWWRRTSGESSNSWACLTMCYPAWLPSLAASWGRHSTWWSTGRLAGFQLDQLELEQASVALEAGRH